MPRLALAVTTRLLVGSALVGAVGGLIGVAFLRTLGVLGGWLGPSQWSSSVVGVVVLGAVGVAVALLTRLLGSPGDVELLVDNIHVGEPGGLRALASLLPESLLCISAGGAMGPEAPLVQAEGTLASWAAHRLRLSKVDVRVLTIVGMASAFTVLFHAPLGGALFALEIPHRRSIGYSEAIVPAIVGSLIAYAVAVATNQGGLVVWGSTLHAPGSLDAGDLGWALAVGVAGAAVAVVFTYLAKVLRWAAAHLSRDLRPVVGGAALGALGVASPYALTFGEGQLEHILRSPVTIGVLLGAALAKLLGTTVTLASGWRGGFIIPLFFIGACLGLAAAAAFPEANEAVLVAAFMAATNVGVTKTPLGSTVVVTEMLGIRVLPTTLIASVVALLLTSETGLLETQRARDLPADDQPKP